ncbi:MAG: methyl-accepting chemotaxis protein [Thermodesulfobacteriota bacterium]
MGQGVFHSRMRRTGVLEWVGSACVSIRQLYELSSAGEEHFLALGKRLQELYTRANEMSKASSAIAAMTADEEVTKAAGELRMLLDQMHRSSGEWGRATETLKSIQGRAEKIHACLTGFQKTVRILHMVCTMVKIETARLGGSESGFHALAEDVKRLAISIESRTCALVDHAASLNSLIQGNLTRTQMIEERQAEHARIILNATMENLRSLNEKRDMSSVALRHISSRWDCISRSIGEVVEAVQFHDITRQRIDHVREAMEELRGRLNTAKSSHEVTDLAERMLKGRHLGGTRRSRVELDKAGLVLNTCRLQTAQLAHAGGELSGAVSRIRSALHAVSGHLKDMTGATREILGDEGQAGRSFLSELEEGLTSLNAALSEYDRMNLELSSTMNQVASTVKAMSGFLKDMEKIGIEINLIALNSAIHSAHIGAAGVALGELSGAIQSLSSDTATQIDAVAEELKCVVASSGALSPERSPARESGDLETGRMTERIMAFMGPLRRMEQDAASLMTRIHEEREALLEGLSRAAEEFTGLDGMERGIKEAGALLEEVIAGLSPLIKGNEDHDKRSGLEHLAARYTMQKERDIHHSVAGAPLLVEPQGAPPGSKEAGPSAEQGNAAGQDLGDNVELF